MLDQTIGTCHKHVKHKFLPFSKISLLHRLRLANCQPRAPAVQAARTPRDQNKLSTSFKASLAYLGARARRAGCHNADKTSGWCTCAFSRCGGELPGQHSKYQSAMLSGGEHPANTAVEAMARMACYHCALCHSFVTIDHSVSQLHDVLQPTLWHHLHWPGRHPHPHRARPHPPCSGRVASSHSLQTRIEMRTDDRDDN
jgi:hypothetical protein